MSELAYRKLSDEEIEQGLAQLQGWSRHGDAIHRLVEFASYKDGVVFACAVAHLADAMDHHPDLTIGYRKVEIVLSTHSVAGLSPYDLELAKRIQTLG